MISKVRMIRTHSTMLSGNKNNCLLHVFITLKLFISVLFKNIIIIFSEISYLLSICQMFKVIRTIFWESACHPIYCKFQHKLHL